MGRKLGFTYLFSRTRDTRNASSSSSSPPPPPFSWPSSCRHPRTHSFRKEDGEEEHKEDITNPCYLDLTESCLSISSAAECESFSTASEGSGGDAVEAVIRGLRSDRLFFEPGGATSSIMEEAAAAAAGGSIPFEGSVAMAVDSEDPYQDFKRSMEEMLMAHGVKDWAWLEEMLGWYLRVNGKKTHGIIVGAFLDLLLSLAPPCSCSYCTSEIEEEEENMIK